MPRMTEELRTALATRPDLIPADATCDRCNDPVVARGTDGHRAFALCADDMLATLEERRSRPRVSAAVRARAIQAAVRA